MKIDLKRKLCCVGLLVLVSLAILCGCVAAENTTEVGLNLYNVTITADNHVQEWGYQLSNETKPLIHHDQSYSTLVVGTKTGSVVSGELQILVNPNAAGTESKGIPAGWTVDASLTSGTGTVTVIGNVLVKITGITSTETAVSISAHNDTQFTVTFNAAGGSPTPASQQVMYGNLVTKPSPDPAKTGYTFGGWYYGTKKWDFAHDAVYGDMMLTAKWLAVPCTVTFEPENGSASWKEVYEYGEKIVQPEDPVKTGYLLEGWYYGSAKWDFENDVVKSDMTLTAHWTPVTYSVRFNANGGSGSMDNQQFVYDVSQNLTVNAFTRSSYSFQGWAESATGSVVYRNHAEVKNLSSVQDDVVDLYAVWRYNGGGGGSGSSKKVEPKIVDEITIEVDFQKIITIPAVDEDGNYVVLPIEQLIMTDPVTGVVYIGDKTEEYDSLTIVPSLKETIKYITEYQVETIAEALAAGIPVYENYIGGNGHAPLLIEDMSETVNPVKFYQVIEITTDVTGGNLKEIIFKVPLAELTEQGFTTTDVVLYHGVKEDSERIWYPLVTTLEWCDETYAYYAAKTDGASPFGILFLKDSTCMEPVKTVSPDSQTTETTASSPIPLAGILAGLLGAGAAVCMRGKKQ